MLPIAIAFVLQALWSILSPYDLQTTLAITLTTNTLLFAASILFFHKNVAHSNHTPIYLYPFLWGIGLLLASLLYIPTLSNIHVIATTLPVTIDSEFKVVSKRYESSITIELNHIDKIKMPDTTTNLKPDDFKSMVVQVHGLAFDLHQELEEAATYHAQLEIRPRYFRNIPGDDQRRLQSLSRNEIGYGKFLTTPQKVRDKPVIEQFRHQISEYFINHFKNGAYLSALSVGKDDKLTQEDWEILRKTGTIHLISISGLHLSLTAFYGFIIVRVFVALVGIRKIPPFKVAAVSSIIIAWGYALLAGMSLPTIRAAIMFSIAMLSLLINRPIFSLQGVALATLIILCFSPLSLLMPGFSLSFIAVIILILSARVLTTPFSALVLTQIIISLLMIPLTASFFGEISLISPLINFFVIPWTSIMIMPFILIGTLLLPFSKILANPFLHLADQAVTVLKSSINLSASIPNASITVSKPPLAFATIITLIPLFLLYLFPFYKHHLSLQQIRITIKRNIQPKIKWAAKKLNILRIMVFGISCLLSLLLFTIYLSNHASRNNDIDIYLMPVGEGLSLLLKSKEQTLLYDAGNRFGPFDAGRDVILPLLKHQGITQIDTIILSQKNLQHTGGFRSIREQLPDSQLIGHTTLMPLVDNMKNCNNFNLDSPGLTIKPLRNIRTSCNFKVMISAELNDEIMIPNNHDELHNSPPTILYLISDIKDSEKNILHQILVEDQKKYPKATIILLSPNQGRKPLVFKDEGNSYFSRSLILHSTKSPHKIYQQISYKQLNAYYGTIHLNITRNKNAKPKKLRIHDFRDQIRYWWLNE